MGKKKNNPRGDMGILETTYGMANRPVTRPLPEGLLVQSSSTGKIVQCKLHGFAPYKVAGVTKVPLPQQMGVGEMMLTAGWIKHQPCFLIVGCQEDIASLQLLPILVLRPGAFQSKHGALVSLELDLHQSEWPVGHWTLTFNPVQNPDREFLLSLTHQQEISVIFVTVPLEQKTISHTIYHPIDQIGRQISTALERADQHIKRLGKHEAEATEIHYLYHLLHQND